MGREVERTSKPKQDVFAQSSHPSNNKLKPSSRWVSTWGTGGRNIQEVKLEAHAAEGEAGRTAGVLQLPSGEMSCNSH